MQLLPIEVVLDLHPPKSKVCAIKFFYFRCLSYFLYHCSNSNLTLGSNTNDGNMYEIYRSMRYKNRENICAKEKKIIAHKTVFTWFGNLPTFMKLQGFYYSQGKIHSAVVQFFSLKNIIKILIFKITVFISYTQDSQWTTKTGQNFFLGGIALGPPRRLVHKCYG